MSGEVPEGEPGDLAGTRRPGNDAVSGSTWAVLARLRRRRPAGVADGEPDGAAEEGGTGAEDAGGYRSRMWAAAERRGVPLATVLTTLLVGFALLDVNVLVVLLLWVLRTIILYTLIAGFIALLLSPAVHLVERAGAPRGLAASAVFVAALVVFLGVVILFTAPLVNAVTHFAKELPTLVKQAQHGQGKIGHLLDRFHLRNWVNHNAPKIAGDITRSLKPAQALSVGATAVSTLVGLGTIAVLTLFLLLESPSLQRAVLGSMRPARARRVARTYREATRSVTGYMLGNACTSVIAGVVVFVTLVLLGVPYPLLLGLWVALVDLLPLVGGLLAGIPVVIVTAFHSLPAGIVVLVVFVVYQQVENHMLNPLIMSRTVRLNPLWVLLAVLVGATLGGRVGSGLGTFVGALFGIPLGGAVQVVAREIRRGPDARQAAGPPPATEGPAGPGTDAGPPVGPRPGSAGPAPTDPL